MAVTTNYGWSTPDNTAYVKDGASAIRTLGSSVDTTLNSVTGGKNVGHVLLNTTTVTSAATTTISNVFTSAYQNYKIEWVGVTSAALGAQNLFINMVASGTPAAAATWIDLHLFTFDSTGPTRNFSAGAIPRAAITGNTISAFTINLSNPFAAANTVYTTLNYERSTVDAGMGNGGGNQNNTVSYDGVQFTTSGGGSLTGTFRIYGLRNS